MDVWVSPESEALIAEQDYLDDAFCKEHKTEQRGFEKEFKQLLKSVRPTLDKIREQDRPDSHQERLSQAVNCKDGSSATLCGGIHQTVTGKELRLASLPGYVHRSVRSVWAN
jgi:hypothetical protein